MKSCTMMQIARALGAILTLVVAAAPGAARAVETCPALFAQGRAPVVTDGKLARDTTALCYEAFAILYSGVSRTPLYAAERLTRASVAAARAVDRADAFHEEDRLPESDRSDLDDYVHSGFDRGHMAPAGDMPSPEAQAQSFTLANVVPQNRSVNRSLWASIEESTRRLALARGELFVVTGPVFEGATLERLNERVLVPTRIYKAIYDPVRREAAAYLAGNDSQGDWRAVSIDELQRVAGLDAFPALPEAARARAMALPEPYAYSREGGRSGWSGRRQEASLEDWARAELHRLLRRMWRDLMRSIF